MGQKMAYLESALLAHVSHTTLWTPPTTIYWVASDAPFDATLTGSTVSEPAGGGYNRVSKPNDNTMWSAPSGSNPASIANLLVVTFPTASADWGTIQAIYVGDASSAGNLLWGTAVPGSGVPIPNLSTLAVAIGAFVVRET